jgi:hypothetical protein
MSACKDTGDEIAASFGVPIGKATEINEVVPGSIYVTTK